MATITEPTKIKLEFKEAVYMYGGDYNQGYNDGKDDGFEEGEKVGYDEGVEVGKANAPREERSVTYNANGTYQVLPSSSELLMDKVNVVVNIPDDGSYSDGYNDGKNAGFAEGEAFGKQNAPTEDLSVTLTSNGTYLYEKPNDKYYADVEVVVKVPSEKTPTQEKSVTITKNGTEVISPDDGYTLSGVSVTTQIDTRLPEQEKTLEVTENKVYEVTPDSGYALKKVTVTGNVAGSGGSGDDSGDNALIKVTGATEEEWGSISTNSDHKRVFALIKNIDWTEFNKKHYTNLRGLFWYYAGLEIPVGNLDTSYATTLASMFSTCQNVKTIDVSNFDTSNVTTMSSMFSNCMGLTSLDLSNWDMGKVTHTDSMFKSCYQLTNINMQGWRTSSLLNMNNMFEGCTKLTSLDLSHFDVSNAKYGSKLFSGCSSLTSLNVSNWNNSQFTSMEQMFSGCSSLTSLDLSNFNTDNVTNMGGMFSSCNKLTDVTFGNNWASNKSITSFEIRYSPLSKDSILDLASKIADKSDTSVYTGTQTVKLKSSQKSLFTADELTALANQFTSKNWTLAWN